MAAAAWNISRAYDVWRFGGAACVRADRKELFSNRPESQESRSSCAYVKSKTRCDAGFRGVECAIADQRLLDERRKKVTAAGNHARAVVGIAP
jgi:hypothetical protein